MNAVPESYLRVRSRKPVFVPRIWFGRWVVRLGFWIMGCRAELAVGGKAEGIET